jgi:hypothetical protein
VKVGVWCAVSARRIVGLVFFNETINCERYGQAILWQFFTDLTEGERLYGWFQQDPATAHTAHVYVGFVQCLQGENYQQWYFASTFTPILILVIFFFWACLKDTVYNSNP